MTDKELITDAKASAEVEDEATREARRSVSPLGAKIMLGLVHGATALLLGLFLAADMSYHWRGRALSPEGLGWRLSGIVLSLGVSAGFWAWSIPKAIDIARAKQSENIKQNEGEGVEAVLAAIADAPDAERDEFHFNNKSTQK